MKKFIFLFSVLSLIAAALIFGYHNSFAANDIANTPYRIDTFTSDVAIGTGPTYVDNITITAYTTAKTVVFIDDDGAAVLVLEVPAGYTVSWPPDREQKEFSNGLHFDQSASELASNDYIFVWTSKNRR